MVDIFDFSLDDIASTKNRLQEQKTAKLFIEKAMLCWLANEHTIVCLESPHHQVSLADSGFNSEPCLRTSQEQQNEYHEATHTDRATTEILKVGSTSNHLSSALSTDSYNEFANPILVINHTHNAIVSKPRLDESDFEDFMIYLQDGKIESFH